MSNQFDLQIMYLFNRDAIFILRNCLWPNFGDLFVPSEKVHDSFCRFGVCFVIALRIVFSHAKLE